MTLVRSFDWVSRLDTRDDPTSLFPDWSADPDDPASYNFAATDAWVDAVHSIGAEVLFTVASSIPKNKLPADDVEVYGRVVEHIVRHYSQGWAGGPATPVRRYEFGDQPDFGPLHFAGRPEEFYAMYRAFCEAVHRVDATLTVGGPSVAFSLEADSPYREGFLRVRARERPATALLLVPVVHRRQPRSDGLPLRRARAARGARWSRVHRHRADAQLLELLAVPSSTAPAPEKGAFMAATAIALQDTVIDHAFFFRADTGRDRTTGSSTRAGSARSTGGPTSARAPSSSRVGH